MRLNWVGVSLPSQVGGEKIEAVAIAITRWVDNKIERKIATVEQVINWAGHLAVAVFLSLASRSRPVCSQNYSVNTPADSILGNPESTIPRNLLKAMVRTSKTAAGRSSKESKALAATSKKKTKAPKAHSGGDDEKIGEKRASNASNASKKKQKLSSASSMTSFRRRALGDISIKNPNIDPVNEDEEDDGTNVETTKQGKNPKMATKTKSMKEKSKAKAVETATTTTTTAIERGTRNRTVAKYCDDDDDEEEEDDESEYEEKVAIAPATRKKISNTANTAAAAKKTSKKSVATASSRQKSAAAGTNAKASTKKSTRTTSTRSILDEVIASPNASPEVISNFTQKFTREIVGDAGGITKKKMKVQKKNKKDHLNDDADSYSHGGEDEEGGDFDNVHGHERTTSTKFEEEYQYRAGVNDDWRCMSVCDW